MKLYASIENEAGKIASKAGNEYLNVNITRGNDYLYRLHFTEKSIALIKVNGGKVIFQELAPERDEKEELDRANIEHYGRTHETK